MIKRAIRQQALPQDWGYGRLSVIDREGRPHYILTRPEFINPLARHGDLRMKPMWKVLPRDQGDLLMSRIRQALQGNPSHSVGAGQLEGRQLNCEISVFDVGKGLTACLLKNGWTYDPHSVKAPTEFDELSRYYLLQKRLELTGPRVVWWMQETGIITNHRSQLAEMPLDAFSQQRLMHVADFFETNLIEGIMSRVHTASQTREKQSFTLEETFENFRTLNSFTMYPLNHIRPNERDVVMVTMSCLASTILDPIKIYSVG